MNALSASSSLSKPNPNPNLNPNSLHLPPKIIRRWDRNLKRNRTLESNPISTKPQIINHDKTDSAIAEFEHLWDQLLHSSSLPSHQTLTRIFNSLASSNNFPRISQLLSQISRRDSPILRKAFSAAISAFADSGQLCFMEEAIAKMVSRGFPVDSGAANARLRCYAARGSLLEMEASYAALRRAGFCVDRDGIRAAASAYLRRRRNRELGNFARAVGLNRPDCGPMVWNILLLSYAAGFRMKSLQREFLRMLEESQVRPDVTTFNLRSVAFSRMSMTWDLHLSLEHMRRDRVEPDLVTYGCIVDAYADRRLVKNLGFALSALEKGWSENGGSPAVAVVTDPLVFEAVGKGDFHASCEAFMEFSNPNDWTYRKLIRVYEKKLYRRDQIFWNY